MEDTITQTENAAPAAVAVEAPAPVESSPAETNTSAPVTESPAPAAEAEAVETKEPESQPRPAQRRIQELVQQNKQLKEQLVAAPPLPQTPSAPRLSDLVQGKDQLMPDELDQLGNQVFQQGAQSASSRTGLEVAQLRREMVMRDAINETDKTAATLPGQYRELNPDNNGVYNPVLEKKIVERYQKEAVRRDPSTGQMVFDPSVKLADVAKEEVEFYREATEAGKAQSSAALASQADLAAVTPTSASPAPEKSFDQMNLKEQENYLRSKGHDI